MDKDTLIKVKNRHYGKVIYKVPDLSIRREYTSGETKEVSYDELKRLSFVPGGRSLLIDYLVIQNEEAVKDILGDVEPEYYYTDKEIKNLLTRESVDALLDCLDFAPAGVIDNLRKVAIDIELNDMNKREVIFEKTGYDIDGTIKLKKSIEADEELEKTEAPKRRVKTEEPAGQADSPATPARRIKIKDE